MSTRQKCWYVLGPPLFKQREKRGFRIVLSSLIRTRNATYTFNVLSPRWRAGIIAARGVSGADFVFFPSRISNSPGNRYFDKHCTRVSLDIIVVCLFCLCIFFETRKRISPHRFFVPPKLHRVSPPQYLHVMDILWIILFDLIFSLYTPLASIVVEMPPTDFLRV